MSPLEGSRVSTKTLSGLPDFKFTQGITFQGIPFPGFCREASLWSPDWGSVLSDSVSASEPASLLSFASENILEYSTGAPFWVSS